jgi:hypothetical protein
MDGLDHTSDVQSTYSPQSPPISPPSSSPDRLTPPRVISLARSSEDIIQFHQLPPVLSRLDETARVQLACLCEDRSIKQGEMHIAEHQYRRMVLISRTYELRLLNAQVALLQAKEKFRSAVDIAVQTVSTAVDPECDGDDNGVSDDFMRHSPPAEMKVTDELSKEPDNCSVNYPVLIVYLPCRIVNPCIVILIYIGGIWYVVFLKHLSNIYLLIYAQTRLL